MRRSRMLDDQYLIAHSERVRAANRFIGDVSKLESSHGIQADQANPIRQEGVLPSLGGQDPSVRMRDDPCPQPPKDTGTEVMVGMVVGEYEPLDRPAGDLAYRPDELLCLTRSGQGVDDDNSGGSDYETGVGPPLHAPPSVPWNCVDIGGQPAGDERRRGGVATVTGNRTGGNENGECGAAEECQAETKPMLTDCLKVAPLLSIHTIVSGASRSALSVKLTTGSRLTPDVHSKRATS